VLERLRNNWGLKLLSLAIAALGWAYLRLTPNPVIAARFVQQITVPISTTGLRADEVAHLSDRTAVVSIAVPRGGASVTPASLRAVLSLDERGPGVYNVPVEVIAPKLEIKSLSPASVTLSIERIEDRTYPIAIRYVGDPRRGVVVDHIATAPATVTLHGPTSDLERVASVRVDVPLPTSPSTLDAMLRPIAVDAHGVEIASLVMSPNLTRVSARFVAPHRGTP
jgi:YbbR domain-containing protein